MGDSDLATATITQYKTQCTMHTCMHACLIYKVMPKHKVNWLF